MLSSCQASSSLEPPKEARFIEPDEPAGQIVPKAEALGVATQPTGRDARKARRLLGREELSSASSVVRRARPLLATSRHGCRESRPATRPSFLKGAGEPWQVLWAGLSHQAPDLVENRFTHEADWQFRLWRAALRQAGEQ